MLDYIVNLASQYSYIGIYFLMLLESSIFIVPSELIMGVAGYLAYIGKINLFIASVFAALGNISGSTILYVLSKWGKVHIIYKLGGKKVKKGVDKASLLFDKFDKPAVLIAQFIPGVRAFISIPAGLFNMNYFVFITITFIGAFLWCFGIGYVAMNLGQNWQSIHNIMTQYEHIVFAILILVFIAAGIWFWIRKNKAKSK